MGHRLRAVRRLVHPDYTTTTEGFTMSQLTTPVEIDTALAKAEHRVIRAEDSVNSRVHTMRVIYAGRVLNHRMRYEGKRAQFPAEATGQAAFDWFRSLDPDTSLLSISNYSGNVGEWVTTLEARLRELDQAEAEVKKLDALYTGWSRFFVVTSSTGHVHSSQACHTCRPTTTYGWLPDLSGQSQDQAIAGLRAKGGDRAASALCSVCFPLAPVQHTGGKITKSQAEKMAA